MYPPYLNSPFILSIWLLIQEKSTFTEDGNAPQDRQRSMKYCSECGAPVAPKIVGPDPRERMVCTGCNLVQTIRSRGSGPTILGATGAPHSLQYFMDRCRS